MNDDRNEFADVDRLLRLASASKNEDSRASFDVCEEDGVTSLDDERIQDIMDRAKRKFSRMLYESDCDEGAGDGTRICEVKASEYKVAPIETPEDSHNRLGFSSSASQPRSAAFVLAMLTVIVVGMTSRFFLAGDTPLVASMPEIKSVDSLVSLVSNGSHELPSQQIRESRKALVHTTVAGVSQNGIDSLNQEFDELNLAQIVEVLSDLRHVLQNQINGIGEPNEELRRLLGNDVDRQALGKIFDWVAWLIATGQEASPFDLHTAEQFVGFALVLVGNGDKSSILDSKAAILAAKGDFNRAAQLQTEANDLARKELGRIPLMMEIRLALYSNSIRYSRSRFPAAWNQECLAASS